ncbi:MAG TPA: hypothetical protein VGJ60_08750 [Chloroflexota bacterium]|jgi:uncharacterized protein YukE
MIRLSESELQELARSTQKQQRNVDDVSRAGESAVRVADSGWRSQAFETFKGRWQQDRSRLTSLTQELARWERQCTQHAQVANRVNQPF